MANPFEKRATEYLRDDEAFLPVVTPEPLSTFFEEHAKTGNLYDKLTVVIGTPGSGKTTIARLFQYQTLRTLLNNSDLPTYKELLASLHAIGAIKDNRPALVGCRLPLETEYREFWEFPYPEDLKTGLMIGLLQARAVLGWLRNLTRGGIDIDNISILPKPDAEAALTAIGGIRGPDLQERAREIETAIYDISAALVPPSVDELPSASVAAYRPLDVIEGIRIKDGETVRDLRPIVIFDDAHSLEKNQFKALETWLSRRELRVSRWILTRLDALTPAEVIQNPENATHNQPAGRKRTREITEIRLQSTSERDERKKAFRKMSKDMAGRYLRSMDVFNRRGLNNLGDILSTDPENVTASRREELRKTIETVRVKYGISSTRIETFHTEVDRYLSTTQSDDKGEDVKLAMVSILLERYINRIPQQSLFGDEIDAEPNKPLEADSETLDGARIHLMSKYNRPYYFGIDTLCDASSENAEQFLQLAARLVAQSETQLIRQKPGTLSSATQHKLLRERATEIIRDWDFPHMPLVRNLAEGIAKECLARSLESNAPLGGGAIACGILQSEFDGITQNDHQLAQVLQFGVAYNAFNLIPNYKTKKKNWCLIELGGVVLLKHGLTLKKGGFLERKVDHLNKLMTGG